MLIGNSIFLHVPKCGGQSVEASLLGINAGKSERNKALLRPNSDPKLGPPRLAHLFYEEYFKFGYCSEDRVEFCFALFRDPVDRFLSEINFRGMQPDRARIHLRNFSLDYLIDDFKSLEDYHRHMVRQVDFIKRPIGNVVPIYAMRFSDFFKRPEVFLRELGFVVDKVPHIKPKASRRGFRAFNIEGTTKKKLEVLYAKDYELFERLEQGQWTEV